MEIESDRYRQIVKRILLQYAERPPNHGEIEMRPVFDESRDSYVLLDIGWDNTGRVDAILLHLMIKEGKIWIETDGTEEGVATELLQAGVPKEKIVLGFYRPQRRMLTGFAVA